MSKKTTRFPCFLRQRHGYTVTNLKNTKPSYKANPERVCTNWHCPIRGDREVSEDVYQPMKVFLGEVNGLEGVVWCEGGGLLER